MAARRIGVLAWVSDSSTFRIFPRRPMEFDQLLGRERGGGVRVGGDGEGRFRTGIRLRGVSHGESAAVLQTAEQTFRAGGINRDERKRFVPDRQQRLDVLVQVRHGAFLSDDDAHAAAVFLRISLRALADRSAIRMRQRFVEHDRLDRRDGAVRLNDLDRRQHHRQRTQRDEQ